MKNQSYNEKIHALELTISEIKADVRHTRDRIDNGMSATLLKLSEKFDLLTLSIAENIMPAIKDSQQVIGAIKSGAKWLIVVGLGGGLFAITFHFINKLVGKL